MLNSKQKRQLKSLAQTLKQHYQLGKKEITDTVVDVLDKALEAHELIKVDVKKNPETPLMNIALDLSLRLNADIVQIIGNVIVLYRRNKENPKIVLVK